MNKLITDIEGGFNLKMDDFRWIENGLIEALKGIVSPFVDENNIYILSGCELSITTNDITLTEGFVYWDGEIYYVPVQQQANLNKKFKYLQVDETFDPSGWRQFKDGIFHNIHAIRQLVLVQDSVLPTGTIPFTNIRTAVSIMAGKLKEITEIYQVLSIQAAGGNNYELRGFVDFSGTIFLSGRMVLTPPQQTGQPLFVLPINFRPNHDVIITLPMIYPSDGQLTLNIMSTGGVFFHSSGAIPATQFVVSCDGVSY
jgi:hypothetical protein